MDAEGGFEITEFQEGTLDTLMERLTVYPALTRNG